MLWVIWDCSNAAQKNLASQGSPSSSCQTPAPQNFEACCKHSSSQSTALLQLCSNVPKCFPLLGTLPFSLLKHYLDESSDKEDLGDGPNYSNMLFVTSPLVRVHFIRAKRIIKQYGNPEHVLQAPHMSLSGQGGASLRAE